MTMEAFDTMIFKLILTVITILLGVIGYFLKQLHSDFNNVSRTIIDMDKRMAIYEERMKSDEKIKYLNMKDIESRLEKLEKRRYYTKNESNK